MKNITDNRINASKGITKEELVSKIQAKDPIRFDQMIIEEEERKTYYYVKYKSLAYTRKPKTLKFPLFEDLVNDFERNVENSGDITILEDDSIIHKVKSYGKASIDTPKYAGKSLVFNNLEIVLENEKVKLKQPIYYIPSETNRCTCNTCNGSKYNTCKETECRGQHIYDCRKCRTTGKIDCEDCRARGEYTCPSCNGRGRLRCVDCGGSGNDRNSNSMLSKCKSCNGSGERKCSSLSGHGLLGAAVKKAAGNEYCGGSGIIRCSTCSASGKITCEDCDGDGRIECKTCYGDHIDNRYGKVDCDTCETAGELASISYIETEIKSDNLDLIFSNGKKIDALNFGFESIKKYIDYNGHFVQTYKNLNGESNETYDEHSSFCSKNAMQEVNVSKDRYPKLISEEMFYEGVPCATLNYNHILTATFHDVSVLSIDKEKDVLFHSNPADVTEEKLSFKASAYELIRQAFSTKSFKDKIDRKHEMFLMIHMAKADGVIEEQEKRYLSQTITGLHGFTQKEKAELFDLMSARTLPPILPTSAYFSTKERAEEARKKIVELVAKADGEYDQQEKTKLEEINNSIELGYKAKPSVFGRFIKTWQVSISILLLICLTGLAIFYFITIYPKIIAEREAKHQAEIEKLKFEQDSFLNAEKQLTNENIIIKEAPSINKINENNDSMDSKENNIPIAEVEAEALNQEENSSEISFYKIQDPDGYSNLRSTPNGTVVKKVYENETFEIIGTEGKFKKVRLSDGTEGYIHESRVVSAN